jgi:hypothetical protein
MLAGSLGLLGTATMLPTVIGLAAGSPMEGDAFVYRILPVWARYQSLTNAGVVIMLAGALCALLLVSGRWPVRIFAVLAAIALIYGGWAFEVDGYWRTQMAINFDATPYYYYVASIAAVLMVLSVLAFVTARHLKRPVAQGAAVGEPLGS